jgi:PKD repeat protein
MSVLELDVWSQIASTTWSFGDGTSGAGLSVSHAYASPGLYTVSATAADAVGNAVTTPPARIDVLPAPPPPPLPAPVLARAANVYLVTGTVLVRVPGSHTFAPLQLGEQIPVGSLIDATHGTVTVTVALPNGTTQSANFYDGEFEFEQARSGTTTAVLAGGTFKGCPAVKHAAFAARRRNSTVRSLWADGHGSFQTRGRYASGAVSGTQWFTQDRCDGTYIKVTRDVVLVSSLVGRHDKRKIRQGHSILVGARGF